MGAPTDIWTFHAPFEARAGRTKKWWSKTIVNEVLLAPLRASGGLDAATHFSTDNGKPVAITSPAQLEREAATWRRATVHLFAGDRDAPSWDFFLDLEERGPTIGLMLGQKPAQKSRERWAGWLAGWCARLDRAGCDLTIGYLEPPDVPYSRPRPPLEGVGWPLGKVELYLGRRYHARERDSKSVLAKLLAAKLVRGVRRDVERDLVRVAFDCDLTKKAAVAKARALGERWLTPLVPTEVAPGWNEHGDEMIAPLRPTVRAPFTFFDKKAGVGYWALVRDPGDGSIDEERWEELSTIARAKKLPDGTGVVGVRLIALVRNEAVVLLETPRAAGFEMVTYPEGKGVYWRVFPSSPA